MIIDPTNIDAINDLARGWAGTGQIHPVAIQRLVIDEDASDAVVECIERFGGGGRVVLVVDDTPMTWAGDLKEQVRALSARAAAVVDMEVLPAPTHGTCAKIEVARRLAEELGPCSCVVAVGSGSVTDVAKYARHLCVQRGAHDLSFISFPTAASVTAYTSALAVLTVAGVKRTLPAAPPDAVICDLRAIAAAPASMTRAGFGDVLARSVSYGDWVLADLLGMTDGYSPIPGRLLEDAESRMIAAADAVLHPVGVRCVLDAVLLAGLAMSLVDQTAPLSGWEHVISHYLDLRASSSGRSPALHGAQVGVATLVAARAYESAWPHIDPAGLLAADDSADLRERIDSMFGAFTVDPGLIAEIWTDQQQKTKRWNANHQRRARFVDSMRQGALTEVIKTHVRPASEVDSALRIAGAPRTFAELDPAVEPQRAQDALLGAHLIRQRFTLGDLLDRGGWLNMENVQPLLYNPAL